MSRQISKSCHSKPAQGGGLNSRLIHTNLPARLGNSHPTTSHHHQIRYISIYIYKGFGPDYPPLLVQGFSGCNNLSGRCVRFVPAGSHLHWLQVGPWKLSCRWIQLIRVDFPLFLRASRGHQLFFPVAFFPQIWLCGGLQPVQLTSFSFLALRWPTTGISG